MPWLIIYSDGAGNKYEIRDGRLSYDPVTPERSSTGTYSGGDPRTAQLDEAQGAELRERVRVLEGETALHGPDRNKGTGAFHVEDEDGKRSFIVERVPALLAFDAHMKALGR